MISIEVHFSNPRPQRAGAFLSSRDSISVAAGKRALIVDDEIMVAWHLESVLQELNMEICGLVSNGAEAIAEGIKEDVDLIFMDVNLADGIDGIEAAKRIRERRHVPIIFVTAYATDSATVSRITSSLGPSVIIGKPATPITVQAALRQLAEI